MYCVFILWRGECIGVVRLKRGFRFGLWKFRVFLEEVRRVYGELSGNVNGVCMELGIVGGRLGVFVEDGLV